MQVVTSDFVSGKKVLLRYDIDVAVGEGTGGRLQVTEDFRLKVGLPTLKLCLENARETIIFGHLGRPNGEDPDFSVAPIYEWLAYQEDLRSHLESGKLKLLENLRFEKGEDEASLDYAKQLASYGEVYVMEAFAAHHPAASTTVLPTLLPHAAGLNFFKEVEKLREIRENPKKPLVVIIGGVKIEDKLPAIEAMSKIADHVLVGGKIASEITTYDAIAHQVVMVASLTEDGLDITQATVDSWVRIIRTAGMILWNGPLGRISNFQYPISNEEELGSEKGSFLIAQAILQSKAEVILGGGDTIAALNKWDLLDQFQAKGFVSTGGGAMLKLLETGTLPTIEALE